MLCNLESSLAEKSERAFLTSRKYKAGNRRSLKRAWWGCGAASALTEAVLAFARENGFAQLDIEVRSDNVRAIRLYEKFGFRKLCTFPAFFRIGGQDIDFDVMLLQLPQI